MPAKDRHHDVVKRALVKSGWNIDDEQVTLETDERTLWVDLQISKASIGLVLFVEIKELHDVDSPVEALANAIGKYMLYRTVLDRTGIVHPLYLAVTAKSFEGILKEQLGRWALERTQIPLLVFDSEQEVIEQWIP